MVVKKDLKAKFKEIDTDGDGFISFEELKIALITFAKEQELHTFTDARVEMYLKIADVDGDGRINYEEFVDTLDLS